MEVRAEALVHVEQRIPLPVASEIEFPANTGDRGSYEPIVDLAGDWPARGIKLFPARLELFELLTIAGHRGRRPVREPVVRVRPHESRNVIGGDGLLGGAPDPEVAREIVEGIGVKSGRGREQKNEREQRVLVNVFHVVFVSRSRFERHWAGSGFLSASSKSCTFLTGLLPSTTRQPSS